MFDIVTDSACDLTPETVRQLGLTVVPFYVSTDGEHYLKEGQEIAVRDFYQFMVDHPGTLPKTSLPSLEDFEKVFRELDLHVDIKEEPACLITLVPHHKFSKSLS